MPAAPQPFRAWGFRLGTYPLDPELLPSTCLRHGALCPTGTAAAEHGVHPGLCDLDQRIIRRPADLLFL